MKRADGWEGGVSPNLSRPAERGMRWVRGLKGRPLCRLSRCTTTLWRIPGEVGLIAFVREPSVACVARAFDTWRSAGRTPPSKLDAPWPSPPKSPLPGTVNPSLAALTACAATLRIG